LPVIKQLVQLAEQKEENFLQDTAERLEQLSELERLKDEELDVIGELISNIYGAIEVKASISNGMRSTDALNEFMKRVQGSVDK